MRVIRLNTHKYIGSARKRQEYQNLEKRFLTKFLSFYKFSFFITIFCEQLRTLFCLSLGYFMHKYLKVIFEVDCFSMWSFVYDEHVIL